MFQRLPIIVIAMCTLAGCHLVARFNPGSTDAGAAADASMPTDTAGDDRAPEDATIEGLGDAVVSDDAVVAEENLVARYRFNSNAHDEINSFDGEDDTNVQYSADGAYFNGSSSYMTLSLELSKKITADFTVAFRVRTAQKPELQTFGEWTNDCTENPAWFLGDGIVDTDVCGDGREWGIALMQEGLVGVEYSCSRNRVDDNSWHLIVFTRERSSGDCFLYVDEEPAVKETCYPNRYFGEDLVIGVGNDPCGAKENNSFFEGYVDDLRFWNVALTADQVNALE